MLAAAPAEETRALRTFQLALTMAEGQREVPVSLAAYFDTVLSQAQALTANPKSANEATLPEAIQLALDMRGAQSLRDALTKLSNFSGLTPAAARTILAVLERPFAARY